MLKWALLYHLPIAVSWELWISELTVNLYHNNWIPVWINSVTIWLKCKEIHHKFSWSFIHLPVFWSLCYWCLFLIIFWFSSTNFNWNSMTFSKFYACLCYCFGSLHLDFSDHQLQQKPVMNWWHIQWYYHVVAILAVSEGSFATCWTSR